MYRASLLFLPFLAFGITSTATAADMYVGEPSVPTVLPAVSGLNGKLALQGGSFDDEGYGAAAGSVSVPLGYRYGLQLDGLAGARDGDFVGGGAAHLFWRDPAFALLGIYGSYTNRDDVDADIGRVGLEAEYYYYNWTLQAVVGAEFIEADNNLFDDDDGFFDFVDLSYYAQDDLRLSIGHRYTNDRHALVLGVEYQLDQNVFSNGVSLFAEGRIGEDDYQGIWAGARMYFGEPKSLIRRHREDDPVNRLDEDLFGLERQNNQYPSDKK